MSQKKQAASSARAGGITDGVIWEQLLVFFFPILFGAFFQQLYNTVDAVVVGRFTGSLELAAVGGSTGTIINLLFGFFIGLSSGATVIIAQFYGAGDKEMVSRSVHTAIALGISESVLQYMCSNSASCRRFQATTLYFDFLLSCKYCA